MLKGEKEANEDTDGTGNDGSFGTDIVGSLSTVGPPAVADAGMEPAESLPAVAPAVSDGTLGMNDDTDDDAAENAPYAEEARYPAMVAGAGAAAAAKAVAVAGAAAAGRTSATAATGGAGCSASASAEGSREMDRLAPSTATGFSAASGVLAATGPSAMANSARDDG